MLTATMEELDQQRWEDWKVNDLYNWFNRNMTSHLKPVVRMKQVVKHQARNTKYLGYSQMNWEKIQNSK